MSEHGYNIYFHSYKCMYLVSDRPFGPIAALSSE